MSLRSHSDVTCDVISYHWQCKIGVKSEWRFHQKTNSYSMEGREPSFSLIGFLFLGVCNVFWFVCLFFCKFQDFVDSNGFPPKHWQRLLLYPSYYQKLTTWNRFILKDKFQNIFKKSPFSFKHSKIYKFLFLRASFVCLSCYT